MRALQAADASWSPTACAGRSDVRPITAQDAKDEYGRENALGFAYLNSAAERDDCGF